MLTWYKSWFRTSGTLDLNGYAKHIIAAQAFFIGFGIVSMFLFWLVLGPLIWLRAPAWAGWLPILICLPLWLLAIGSWVGILIASTMRFFRHLKS